MRDRRERTMSLILLWLLAKVWIRIKEIPCSAGNIKESSGNSGSLTLGVRRP
jgi:hypothetical protein